MARAHASRSPRLGRPERRARVTPSPSSVQRPADDEAALAGSRDAVEGGRAGGRGACRNGPSIRGRTRPGSRATPRRALAQASGGRPRPATKPSTREPGEDAQPVAFGSRSGPQTKQVGKACSRKPGEPGRARSASSHEGGGGHLELDFAARASATTSSPSRSSARRPSAGARRAAAGGGSVISAGVRAEQSRDEAAGVAAVRRGRRAVEARIDDNLHRFGRLSFRLRGEN